MKKFSSPTQKTGEIGENIACKYLEAKGFIIIERNFTRKCGEIDIVARKTGVTHFVEVKTVSRESLFRPEDQMHFFKQQRLVRTVKIYLAQNRKQNEIGDWQFDVICVYLNYVKRTARVTLMSDIVLCT